MLPLSMRHTCFLGYLGEHGKLCFMKTFAAVSDSAMLILRMEHKATVFTFLGSLIFLGALGMGFMGFDSQTSIVHVIAPLLVSLPGWGFCYLWSFRVRGEANQLRVGDKAAAKEATFVRFHN
jgi:hypothetical protein